MLDERMLAAVGVSRLLLAIPTAKLFVIHDIANGLRDPDGKQAVGEALLEWLSRLHLESEVLEASAALVLARDVLPLTSRQVRDSIRCPSLVSDYYLDSIFGADLWLHTGPIRHSGPPSAFYDSRAIVQRLRKGDFVPPVLGNNLQELEARTGHGFLGQWAHEFETLSARNPNSDGQLSYFFDADRDQSTGQFIARRGHIARSAYLRALAFAIDAWDMPETLALATALHASPFDDFYLRMPAGQAPSWSTVVERRLSSATDASELVSAMLAATSAFEPGQVLLQFNGPVGLDRKLAADMEIVPFITTCCIECPSLQPTTAGTSW